MPIALSFGMKHPNSNLQHPVKIQIPSPNRIIAQPKTGFGITSRLGFEFGIQNLRFET
jgi:hypothetical protein